MENNERHAEIRRHADIGRFSMVKADFCFMTVLQGMMLLILRQPGRAVNGGGMAGR